MQFIRHLQSPTPPKRQEQTEKADKDAQTSSKTSLQLPMSGPTRCGRARLSHEAAFANAQRKVNQNDNDQTDTNDSRAPALVIDALDVAALADLVDAPDVQEETVDEGAGGEDGKGPGGGEGSVVSTEVEEGSGDAA